MKPGSNSFDSLATLDVDGVEFHYFSLERLADADLEAVRRLPYSLKVLLENILRFENGGEDATGNGALDAEETDLSPNGSRREARSAKSRFVRRAC